MNLSECFEFSSPVVGSNLQTGKQHRFCYDDPPSAHNKLKLVFNLVNNLIWPNSEAGNGSAEWFDVGSSTRPLYVEWEIDIRKLKGSFQKIPFGGMRGRNSGGIFTCLLLRRYATTWCSSASCHSFTGIWANNSWRGTFGLASSGEHLWNPKQKTQITILVWCLTSVEKGQKPKDKDLTLRPHTSGTRSAL